MIPVFRAGWKPVFLRKTYFWWRAIEWKWSSTYTQTIATKRRSGCRPLTHLPTAHMVLQLSWTFWINKDIFDAYQNPLTLIKLTNTNPPSINKIDPNQIISVQILQHSIFYCEGKKSVEEKVPIKSPNYNIFQQDSDNSSSNPEVECKSKINNS